MRKSTRKQKKMKYFQFRFNQVEILESYNTLKSINCKANT